MNYSKFYSSIKFPIEEDFCLESEEVKENQITLVKSIFLISLATFSNLIIKLLNLKVFVDKKWKNKNKSDTKSYILNALTYVDHFHSVVIFNKFNIRLDHFFYIFLRKLFLIGSKDIYPICLEKNFQLRAIYEMSNFRLKNIYSKENIKLLNQLFFDKTSSVESLIAGRNIIGKISDNNYDYLINKYFN